MKIIMCFKHLEASHIMHLKADTKTQLSDFKSLQKLFQFLKYGILRIINQKF